MIPNITTRQVIGHGAIHPSEWFVAKVTEGMVVFRFHAPFFNRVRFLLSSIWRKSDLSLPAALYSRLCLLLYSAFACLHSAQRHLWKRYLVRVPCSKFQLLGSPCTFLPGKLSGINLFVSLSHFIPMLPLPS